MNFIIPSSNYRYLKCLSLFSPKAKRALSLTSGVEPLFLALRPMIDWDSFKMMPRKLKKVYRLYSSGAVPLNNKNHGIRLHGFIDFGPRQNQVNYLREVTTTAKLFQEQINIAQELAKISGVDDSVFPSVITIHLGRSSGDLEKEIDNFARACNQVANYATARNVIINFENMCGYFQGKYDVGSDFFDFQKVFSKLDKPEKFGITFDFSHAMIFYQGDYQKIKNDLVASGVLPHINYLHLTMPHRNYKENKNIASQKRGLLSSAVNWIYNHPDTHAGLRTFFKHCPEEKQSFWDLFDFLIKNSKVAAPQFNVINLELGLNVWGTNKGSSAKDVLYTLEQVSSKFKT